MMLGDEEDIVVTGSVPDSASVESTAPSVVSVKKVSRTCCLTGADAAATVCRGVALNDACTSKESPTLTVTVDALADGSSDLRVAKSDGSVWGAVTLSVEKAISLGLTCNTKGAVTLAQGDGCLVTVSPADANGTPLMFAGANILIDSSNRAVVFFDTFSQVGLSGVPVNGCSTGPNGVDMFAEGPGDAVVTATAAGSGGGATETLAVRVTM